MSARCANAPALRAKLRAATHEHHQSLDTALGQLDLAERQDYARFLGIQARARAGVEAWLTRYCPREWMPPSQADLLRRDLSALDYPPPRSAPAFAHGDEGPVAWLGAAWVLAGSSLGNRMMERDLAARAPSDWPMAFLRDDAMPAYFKALRPLLESGDVNPGAERTARAVFDHFMAETREQLGEIAA